MLISIRRASDFDKEQIVQLCIKLAEYESSMINRSPDKENIRARVTHDLIYNTDCAYFVAVLEHDIIGTLKISENSKGIAKVSQSYVVEKYRCMGIMTSLFSKALEWARERGINRIYLTVVSKNTRALDFWSRFGFRVDRTKGRNLIQMSMDVEPSIIS